jgi:myo-inositol-1(or 4)-monophosphatase
VTGPPSEDELLAVAEQAARAAAAELLARFGQEPVDVRSKSTPTDPVSAADLAAEAAIRAVLTRERPSDAILGEEGGETAGVGDLRWVVDPLDGTVNYLYGIPQFAVSVACEDAEGAVAGVVIDPIRGECFTATRSGQPRLDGAVIRPSGRTELGKALVATGFAYAPEVRARQAETVGQMLPRVRDIRRIGAAALDLCWCACGRYDAYFERGLHHWDHAAGALLCLRAGLSVRLLEADGAYPYGIAVAGPDLIDEFYELVAPVPPVR